jgi:serine/threonine protein kinase
VPLHGERLDKPSYAILRSLKGGNVGEAWLVDQKIFGQKCVQKRYSTLGLEDTAAYLEPRILFEVKHDNIVRVIEADYDPDMKYAITFVTVYCEGRSVAHALDEDYRFSIHQALGLAREVLSALAHVHTRHRIIHRDAKPGNVFLNVERVTAYLGDFGSAARMGADGTVGTIDGASPLYTPPEAGPVDGRVAVTGDIYGVGMTVFEMLNGPFPYAEIDPAVVDRRLTRGQRALPASAFVFQPHVPPDLRAIVRKSLRANPRDRFQSCSEFITAINRLSCVDWIHADGEGLGGVWEGTWPPHVRRDRRRRYRVVSKVLGAGPNRGRLRLEAYQASSASAAFARFGVDDETVDADDRDAVDRFFRAVETRAAHLCPAL